MADVSVKENCVRALKEATTKIGKVPEYVFCIAGTTREKIERLERDRDDR